MNGAADVNPPQAAGLRRLALGAFVAFAAIAYLLRGAVGPKAGAVAGILCCVSPDAFESTAERLSQRESSALGWRDKTGVVWSLGQTPVDLPARLPRLIHRSGRRFNMCEVLAGRCPT